MHGHDIAENDARRKHFSKGTRKGYPQPLELVNDKATNGRRENTIFDISGKTNVIHEYVFRIK